MSTATTNGVAIPRATGLLVIEAILEPQRRSRP